jgi:hypothetical protein
MSAPTAAVRQVPTSFRGANVLNGGATCHRADGDYRVHKNSVIYKWLPRAECEAESTGAIHFVSSTSKKHHTPVTKIKEAK